MTAPIQKPGRSKQDYSTPADFMRAATIRFGPFAWDLAADASNAKAPNWIGVEQDSLTVDWHKLGGRLWLNPPFAHIEPWAAKCLREAQLGAQVYLLTPASVGSNWYRDHIHGKAYVLFLNGRITFEGCPAPYPKDCMVSIFGRRYAGCDVWDWRRTLGEVRRAA